MKDKVKLVLIGVTVLLIACNNLQRDASEKKEEEKQIKNVESVTTRKLEKFEPGDGRVLLFVGQELEAVGGLKDYNDGYLDHFKKPAGWTTYTNINPGENSFGRIQEGLDGIYDTHDWGDNDYNVSLQLADEDYGDMALAIGLQFVNHEEKVADGTHDKYIDQLADFLLSLGKRPVFLRIAYEFDGYPWNNYDRESCIKAYKRMVDRIRAKGVTNTAFVWQSTGFVSNQEQLEKWYPGDNYVDWCGFSFFNRWKEQEMIEFARKKGKPVFIAEAAPTISDFQAKFTGDTRETQLSNQQQALEAWDKWFIPFFKTIDDNPDVVKAVHYINCHWDSHRMWFDNPTFKRVDSRLQLSDTISKLWKIQISDPKYIHSSKTLYDSMWNNE